MTDHDQFTITNQLRQIDRLIADLINQLQKKGCNPENLKAARNMIKGQA